MIFIPYILSLLLFLFADFFSWKYTKVGKFYSELSKLSYVLMIVCFFWMWKIGVFEWKYVISWFILHYVIQQVGQGLLRYGKPLYLGVGWFDKVLKHLTGGQPWFYALSLVVALFVGIHNLIRK